MKQEAVERIKQTLTPEVLIVSCYDDDNTEEIKGEVEHRYHYPTRKGGPPISWGTKFQFTADPDGNITSTKGLF
jgi:hypothetical protein